MRRCHPCRGHEVVCTPPHAQCHPKLLIVHGGPHRRRPPLPFAHACAVTGNKRKLEEVVAILGESLPFTIVSHKVDLPELQGEPEDVSSEKCKLAAAAVNGPVLVEDTSLCYNALNGMPGVYIKWFLEKTGHEGLNKILAGYEDKSAYAQCVFAFAAGPGAEPKVFVGQTPGKIVEARGPEGSFGWDPIFQPDGFETTCVRLRVWLPLSSSCVLYCPDAHCCGVTATPLAPPLLRLTTRRYAEMSKEDKNKISHRGRSLAKVGEYLTANAAAVEAQIVAAEAAAAAATGGASGAGAS